MSIAIPNGAERRWLRRFVITFAVVEAVILGYMLIG